MVVTPGFDIGIRQEEDGEDNGYDIPLGEDESDVSLMLSSDSRTQIESSVCGEGNASWALETRLRLRLRPDSDSRESIDQLAHLARIIKRTERDHSWNLQQADL